MDSKNEQNEQAVGPCLGPNQIRVSIEAGYLTGPTVIIYDRARGGHNVVASFPWGTLRYGSETLLEAITHAIGELVR